MSINLKVSGKTGENKKVEGRGSGGHTGPQQGTGIKPKLNFKHLEGDLITSPDTNFRYFLLKKNKN